MVTVVALAAPLAAYVWAACCVALCARVLGWVCGALAQTPDLASQCADEGLGRTLLGMFAWPEPSAATWVRIRGDAKAFAALTFSFIGVVVAIFVAVGITGWPVLQAYSPDGLAVADPAGSAVPWRGLLRTAPLAVFAIVFETVRGALLRAHAAEVHYWVPSSRSWSALRLAAPRRESMVLRPKGSGPDGLRLTWPSTYVAAEARRQLAAVCYVRRERVAMASAVVLLVVIGVTAHCWIDLRTTLPGYGKALFRTEIALLFVVTAVPTLAPVRRAAVIPLRLRVQIGILACLATVPASVEEFGWTDPLGTHRSALAAVARDLRSEAHRVERRSALADSGGHPYAVVLRAVARAVTEHVTGKQSLDEMLPKHLRLALTRTVAVMAGAKKDDALRELATSVQAFAADGSPQPDLLGRPPGRIAVWTQALPARIESTRRMVSALIVIVFAITTLVLLLTGRIHRESLPSWVKP